MRGAHIGDPVADRGAHRLLQRPRTRLDRNDLGAEQAHALDVRRLAPHVLGAHVDDALEAEQRAGGGRGDAVLTGAGLGDHAALPHFAGKQRLADRVVDLVRAGVGEVLALQVDPAPDPLGEPVGAIERRRPTDVVAKQGVELPPELRVVAGGRPCGGQLVQRSDQNLGDVAAAVGAEALLDRRRAHATTRGSTDPRWALSKNPAISAWSLTPGSASTPLATSTANGRAAAIPSATFSGVRPPARISGTSERRPDEQLPVEALTGAAGGPRPVGVEQVEVGAVGLGGPDVGAAAHPQRLDHLAAGPPRGLLAEGRPLVAVELDHGQRLVLGRSGELVEASG